MATYLPISSQKLILKKLGNAIIAAEGEDAHCNVFGGVDSCISVPESDYAKLCEAYEQKVDCAFEMEATQGIYHNPDTIMRQRLTADNGKEFFQFLGVIIQRTGRSVLRMGGRVAN
jgi:hypothetical protein